MRTHTTSRLTFAVCAEVLARFARPAAAILRAMCGIIFGSSTSRAEAVFMVEKAEWEKDMLSAPCNLPFASFGA